MKTNKQNDADDLLTSVVEALRRSEPRLMDPDQIPDRVMQAINELPRQKNSELRGQSTTLRFLVVAQRFLTAASVCLLLLYGTEEFITLKKVNQLEKQTISVRSAQAPIASVRMARNTVTVKSLQQRFPQWMKFVPAKEYLSQNQDIESLKHPEP